MKSQTRQSLSKQVVIAYPRRERMLNRVREWESQFWLLVMSGVVIVYMALADLKARLQGKKLDSSLNPTDPKR